MWRIRRRGWPRSSEYVVGPPQYWIEEQRQAVPGAGQVGRLRVQPQQHLVARPRRRRRRRRGARRTAPRRPARTASSARRSRSSAIDGSRYRRPRWPLTRHRPTAPARRRSPPTSPSAPPRPTRSCARCRTAPRALGRRGADADRRRPGRPADAAHPPRRRPPGGRGRHVHRVLVDLHRPRPGARRPPAVLRRQRGVHGHRPRGLGRGRASPTASSCASRRPSRRCRRCRPTRRSTSRSSTPTRAATPPTSSELVPRVRPGGLLLADNTLWSGRVVDEPADDDDTVGDPGVQRPRRRRRPGRELHPARSATA